MSDNEYLTEEEDEEQEEEEEEDDEEQDHDPRSHTKVNKPLTPLTFGRTFTNQHRIKSEEEDEDEEEDDGMGEEEVDDDEEPEKELDEEEKVKTPTTRKTPHKGKRKRSKKQSFDDDENKNQSDSDDETENSPNADEDVDAGDDDDENEEDLEDDDEDEDQDEGEAERYMHQFEKDLTKEYILETHPECIPVNMSEVRAMLPVIRNEDGIIVDDFHRTVPIVTKYEKARIIGQRAMQLNSGAVPYILVDNLIDGATIAELEFEQKKIPVIIKRPIPNGAFEYWRLQDLEILE
jgi:DNA-directed RNA polymerase subunit K/omega